MGEEALQYGHLADMERLSILLEATTKMWLQISHELQNQSTMLKDAKNQRRNMSRRLDGLKDDMHVELTNAMNRLAALIGGQKYDISDEEIEIHLRDAFKKFDENNSGRIGQREFLQAWIFLGLSGTDEEIRDAFSCVDTDNSGGVDIDEFITAITNERLPELNVQNVLRGFDVQLNLLEDTFTQWQNAAIRRRQAAKDMFEKTDRLGQQIIDKICSLVGETPSVDDKRDFFKNLKMTFNTFDKDKTGALGREEYFKVWEFLEQKGGKDASNKAFDAVDQDRSGFIEFSEFAFSLMGEDALAYLYGANTLSELSRLLDKLAVQLEDLTLGVTDHRTLMAELQEVRRRLSHLQGLDKAVDPEDIDALLTDTFNKLDTDHDGCLESWQFTLAWESLNLPGEQDEMLKCFEKFSTDNLMTAHSFKDCIRKLRGPELYMNLILRLGLVLDAPGLQSIGQAYTELKESHERLARTSRRRRLRDIAFQDAVQRLLSEIKKTAEGILGKKSNDADYPKRRLLQTLRHAFEQLDTDGSNTLSFDEFVQAYTFLGQQATIDEMRKAFAEVDVDGSGQIDWFEFAEAILGSDSAHQTIQQDLNQLTVLMDEFKVMKLPREPKPIAMVPDVLGRERERLLQLESEKADLLKRIQKLKNDLDYCEEEEDAIVINRELVNELGNLKRILEAERKQRSHVRLLESNTKQTYLG